MDVEGYEPQVLQGATAVLADPQLRAVMLEADTPALQHTMEAAGFQRYQYDLFSRTLSPADASPQANTSHNQLWIRDLSFVQQRCHTAPVLRVGGVEL